MITKTTRNPVGQYDVTIDGIYIGTGKDINEADLIEIEYRKRRKEERTNPQFRLALQ